MKIFALVTDAFGGRGGIAKFNRDLLTALCEMPETSQVVVWPRIVAEDIGPLPVKLHYVTSGLNSKSKYVLAVLRDVFKFKKADYLICGHINLLPLAWFLKWIGVCRKVYLIIHGIEVWKPQKKAQRFLKKVDALISVSNFTRNKMMDWARINNMPYFILSNSIDLNKFSPGNKNEDLLMKYDLKNKKVLLTLGRLAGKERSKGFDEILEIMPELLKTDPNIRYVIAGDGPDRKRLEEKATQLGIRSVVVFTGYVEEETKKDLYRIADVFVMPGRCEGFGIVYLEALACGTCVVGSQLDGSREALMDGSIGFLANPDHRSELQEIIQEALNQDKKKAPELLQYFSFSNYKKRVAEFFNAY